MSLSAEMSSLIATIYDSVQDHARWDQALETMVARLHAHFIMVAILDLRKHSFPDAKFHGDIPARTQDAITDYRVELYRSDPSIQYTLRNPGARHAHIGQIFGESDFRDNPYFRWSSSELGSADWNLSYSLPQDGLTLGVSTHRGIGKEPFGKDELLCLRLLFNHLENAKRLACRPPDLQSCSQAILLLDRLGQVVTASPAAHGILDSKDGLTIEGRRIRCTAQRAFDNLLRSAMNMLQEPEHGTLIPIPRPSGRRAWIVQLTSLSATAGPFAPFGAVVQMRIFDPDRRPSDAASRWRRLFGLTHAETRLAKALLSGDDASLRQTAERLGIAYATARVQLASIFAKCGVSSQAQLARLLTALDA